MNSPQVGWWVYRCCEGDLRQVTDPDELGYLLLDLQSDPESPIAPKFFPTQEAALQDLANVVTIYFPYGKGLLSDGQPR